MSPLPPPLHLYTNMELVSSQTQMICLMTLWLQVRVLPSSRCLHPPLPLYLLVFQVTAAAQLLRHPACQSLLMSQHSSRYAPGIALQCCWHTTSHIFQPARVRPPSPGRGRLLQAWQSPVVTSPTSSLSSTAQFSASQDLLPPFATPPIRRAANGVGSTGVSQQKHVAVPPLMLQVMVGAMASDSLPPPHAQGEGEGVTPLAKGVTGVHI
jgi:hypothetical protein